MWRPQNKLVKVTASTLLVLSLAACGGGGGGGGSSTPPVSVSPPPPPPPPPPPAGPSWSAGVFEPASQFKDRCQSPRSGVDIEGNAFPDQAGSTLLENFWLRSWTNETYLWNNEVTDRNPAGFSNPVDYFDVLKTTATTASGEDKDDFHFSQSTEDFLEQRNSTASPGYGARIVAFSTSPPRDYRIQYTEPSGPAATLENGVPKWRRGTRILEIDGVSLVNGSSAADIDVLNAGLFPQTVGETHTFVVRDPGSSTDRTVTLAAANVSPKPVNRTSIIDTPSGKVGYMLFNTFSPFSSEQDLVTAINSFESEGVSDLVLDLRYNGGGLLAVASQLSYMIAGNGRTSGRTFEQLVFNTGIGGRNPVTGSANGPIPFYTTGLGFSVANGTALRSLNLNRVFVLSTGRTCSASEAVINGLRGIDVEVILIGDTTCGKPYGFYPTDNCGETYYTIQFRGVNDKNFGDFADGFVPMNSTFNFGVRTPGCVVTDDLTRELGDVNEALLATALSYRNTGSCPATVVKPGNPPVSRDPQFVPIQQTVDGRSMEGVFDSNRDMTLPER